MLWPSKSSIFQVRIRNRMINYLWMRIEAQGLLFSQRWHQVQEICKSSPTPASWVSSIQMDKWIKVEASLKHSNISSRCNHSPAINNKTWYTSKPIVRNKIRACWLEAIGTITRRIIWKSWKKVLRSRPIKPQTTPEASFILKLCKSRQKRSKNKWA